MPRLEPFRRWTIPPALVIGTSLVVGIVVVWLCYLPGLGGPFLFDDFVNLDELGKRGGIDSLDKLLHLLFDATYNPSRLVSFASLLLDDYAWPSEPYSFKVHNVLFHLLCGVVLAWLTMRLALVQGAPIPRAAGIGLLAAALWLLHPLQVSTVLYIVQRMAILSALFVLAGLLLYVAGRQNLSAGRIRAAFVQMTTGIGLGMPLAYFSKENGALLPLFPLLLDLTVLRRLAVAARTERLFRVWRAVMLYTPIAFIVAWFVVHWNDTVLAGYLGRTFTLEQRLLTEGRVLWDYLFHIFIPRVQTNGLYYDNFPVSTGWLSPPTTLFAWLGIAGLLLLAWRWRERRPVLALAILFYFAGHLIESTFVALEIYFEHRNYLPMAMLGFAASYHLVTRLPGRAAVAAGATALAVFSAFTYARSSLWGDADLLALTWAERNPGSLRAQQQAAITWMSRGYPERAEASMKKAIDHHPKRSILHVQYLGVRCATGRLEPSDIVRAQEALRSGIYDSSLFSNLSNLVELQLQGRCPQLTQHDLEALLRAAMQHPALAVLPGLKQDLHFLLGQLYLASGQTDQGRQELETAYRLLPDVEAGLNISALLATFGQYREALALLDRLPADRASSGKSASMFVWRWKNDYYQREIEHLRNAIRQDMDRDGVSRERKS